MSFLEISETENAHDTFFLKEFSVILFLASLEFSEREVHRISVYLNFV